MVIIFDGEFFRIRRAHDVVAGDGRYPSARSEGVGEIVRGD